jgi:drug/metabolite transporter (DMT)-like permease
MVSTKVLLLICVVIWGWTFVATKICIAYLDPIALIGLRFMMGLPLLFALIRAQGLSMRLSTKDFHVLAISAAIIGLHFLTQAVALIYTTATNTGWIGAVTPLVIAILSYFILREVIGWNAIAGIVVAMAGIALLVSQGDFTSFGWLSGIGDWLVLASAFTWAVYTIATRDISRSRNSLVVTFFVLAPMTFASLVYAFFVTDIEQITAMPMDGWIALVFLGVMGTLAQWIWQIGIADIGATKAGVFLYLEPVATTLLAVPLLNERFGMDTAIGGALVLFGVWLAEKKPGTS